MVFQEVRGVEPWWSSRLGQAVQDNAYSFSRMNAGLCGAEDSLWIGRFRSSETSTIVEVVSEGRLGPAHGFGQLSACKEDWSVKA